MLAERYERAESTIHTALARYAELLDRDQDRAYVANREPLRRAVERKLLLALGDDDKIKAASLNNTGYAYMQVRTDGRLDAGQSTANLSLHLLVETVERDRAKTRSASRASAPAAITGETPGAA